MQRISVQLEDAEKEALARAARLNARSTSAEAALRLRMSLQHDRLGGIAAFSSGALAEPDQRANTEPGNSSRPAANESVGMTPVRPPGSASAPAKTASDVAASISGVNLGAGSLVKEATPFPKGKQAGRAKT